MPIYEYYCKSCHTVFNFFARSSRAYDAPACPNCNRKPLEKKISRFAISRGMQENSVPDALSEMDEGRMDSAMMAMAARLESVDESDPRAMASAMRELFQSTGMQPNETIQEAMRRMEAGEDPDKVEEEMGSDLDATDPEAMFTAPTNALGRLRRMLEPPNVDPNLYDL
jgi:putative FmdB family regulatory protein